MAIPTKIVGAGNNSAATNVIRIVFSEATSSFPKLLAYDNMSFNSTLNQVFTGTAGNGMISMLSAVATTNTPPVAAWKPVAATAGGATINRLKGSTSYVNLSNAIVPQNGSIKFNLCWEIPSDASIPANLASVLVIEFNFSGAAPVLTWQINSSSDGGTESVPVWVNFSTGSPGNKFIPADAGSTPSTVTLHRPPTGIADNPELWAV